MDDALHNLIEAAKRYRLQIIPGDEAEYVLAGELDYAISAASATASPAGPQVSVPSGDSVTLIERLGAWAQDDPHVGQSARSHEPHYPNPAALRADVRALIAVLELRESDRQSSEAERVRFIAALNKIAGYESNHPYDAKAVARAALAGQSIEVGSKVAGGGGFPTDDDWRSWAQTLHPADRAFFLRALDYAAEHGEYDGVYE